MKLLSFEISILSNFSTLMFFSVIMLSKLLQTIISLFISSLEVILKKVIFRLILFLNFFVVFPIKI